MKKSLCLGMAVLPLALLAQDAKYTLTGKVGNYNAPAKIYLQYRVDTKSVTDSALLVNGQFSFTGIAVPSPKNAYLVLNDKGTGVTYNDYKSIYLEPGNDHGEQQRFAYSLNCYRHQNQCR